MATGLHLFCKHPTKSIEGFGFRCFFAAKTLKKVWVKMWVNCLTHTVTHIGWQSAALHAPWVQRNVRKEPKSTGEEALPSLRYFCAFFLLT